MKNTKLRMIWIIPNILLYVLLIGLTGFIAMNQEGIQDLGLFLFTGWTIMLLLLAFVTVFGSFRILSWIKDGKM